MTATPEQKAVHKRGRRLVERAEKKGSVSSLGRLQDVLNEQGVDLSDLGSVRVLWHKTRVDENGDEQYAGSSVLLAPSWEEGPKWQPVDHARPISVRVPKAPKQRMMPEQWRTAVILPDPQIGYRRLPDGDLDPFHDPRALDVATQIMEAERPDLAVCLGDFLDLAPMSLKFRQEPAFALTVQPAIEKGHEVLATWRALCDRLTLLEGNHDLRLMTYVMENAVAAYGLKRAASPPDHWPVLSVPYLLRLNELDIKYVGGYPNGATYINEDLACIHGVKLDMRALARSEHVSVIQGHTHRIESVYQTRNSRNEPIFTGAFSPGCLCRIDGAVPSVKASLPRPNGRPVRHWENWTQGVMVVRYKESGRFHIEQVPILEGEAIHRGQVFTSNLSVTDR